MQIYYILTHLNIQYKKISFVNSTSNLIRKIFKLWETIGLIGANISFKNSNICLKAQIVSLATNTMVSLKMTFTCVIFEKIPAKSQF